MAGAGRRGSARPHRGVSSPRGAAGGARQPSGGAGQHRLPRPDRPHPLGPALNFQLRPGSHGRTIQHGSGGGRDHTAPEREGRPGLAPLPLPPPLPPHADGARPRLQPLCWAAPGWRGAGAASERRRPHLPLKYLPRRLVRPALPVRRGGSGRPTERDPGRCRALALGTKALAGMPMGWVGRGACCAANAWVIHGLMGCGS
nr:YLP motif-containing protein 1-like [Caretta caretta]